MNSVLSPTEETHLLDIPIPVSNILSLPSPKCKEENYTKEQDITIFHKKGRTQCPPLQQTILLSQQRHCHIIDICARGAGDDQASGLLQRVIRIVVLKDIITKSSKTSATDLRNCPFIVSFLAIIRPHAFLQKCETGMRSNFAYGKRKNPENHWVFRVLVETGGLVYSFSFGENRGVAAVKPSASDARPRRIFLSSPLHSPIKKKNHTNWCGFLFGGDWGTRTLDLMRVKHRRALRLAPASL